MMKAGLFKHGCIAAVLLLCASCDKGYEARVANYYTEAMDTVKLGDKIVFSEVGIHATTEFRKLDRGTYPITFITKSRKFFYSSFFIPGKGEGKRTVQIDASRQISILEE